MNQLAEIREFGGVQQPGEIVAHEPGADSAHVHPDCEDRGKSPERRALQPVMERARFERVLVSVPPPVVLGTDVFDRFLEKNNLLYANDGEAALSAVHAQGVRPESALVRRSSLEDVFLHLTGRTLVD